MHTNEEIIKKAESYLKEGIYVVPGPQGKKFPYNGLVPGCKTVSYNIKDYPDIMALLELFKKHPDSNIIALTGNGFGLIVIDIDVNKHGKFTAEGLALIEALKDYPTYTKKTPSNGLQYLYWIDPKSPLVGRKTGYKSGVDILLDGASPMPPSKAFSSKINAVGEYAEDDSIDLQPITLFPYELFPDLIYTPENKEKLNTGKRDRIQEQLDKGKITEYRNDTFHHIAVKLNASFPNEPKLAWNLIKSFYESHADKKDFPVSELKQIFNSALKGKVVADAKAAAEAVEEEQIVIDTAKYGDPPVVFWNQLKDMEIPETSFLVKGLIIERSINYIYGKPGVYKTWLAQYLALCIAKSIPAFGNENFSTKQCKVLFVDKDNDPYQMKLRVESLGGLDVDRVANFLDSALFRVENEEAVKRLINCIKKHDFGLVAFDTSRDIHKGEEDSSTEMNNVNQVFKRIIRAGCAVLAISHTKKQADGDLIDLMRGSTAIGGSAANMILVEKPDENTIALQMGKIRYGEKIKPMTLKILKDTNGITGFEYAGEYTKEVQSEQSRASNRTTKETAQRFITSKLINDKLSGLDGTLKATILDEASIQKLNLRAVEDELQALVRLH